MIKLNLKRDLNEKDWGIFSVNPIFFNKCFADLSELPTKSLQLLNKKWDTGEFLTNDELHILGRYMGSNLHQKIMASKQFL